MPQILENYLIARAGGSSPCDAARSALSPCHAEPELDHLELVQKIADANKVKDVLAALLSDPHNYDHLIDLLGDEMGETRCKCLRSRLISLDDIDQIDRDQLNRRYLAKDRLARLLTEE